MVKSTRPRSELASIYPLQSTKMLLFPSAEKKTQNTTRPNVNRGSAWSGLGRHHPKYRDLVVVVLMPCRAADRKVVSQSLGSYSRRPCSRPLEGRREYPSACPRCCHPSHCTAAVQRHRIRDSMVRIVQRHCRQRIDVSNCTVSRHQRKTPHPNKHSILPPKTPQKGGDNPIHTRSTSLHPETPMHKSRPQPPSYNLNPSARDTSEEYRPPIHKTLLPSSVPIPTQNTPRVRPSAVPCDGKSPAIYNLPSLPPSFPSMILPCPPDGSCTGVWECGWARVLCNHTIWNQGRTKAECRHGKSETSQPHPRTHTRHTHIHTRIRCDNP